MSVRHRCALILPNMYVWVLVSWLHTRNTRRFMYNFVTSMVDHHRRWSRRVRQNKVSFYHIFNAHRAPNKQTKNKNENGMLNKTRKKPTPLTTRTSRKRSRVKCVSLWRAHGRLCISFFIFHFTFETKWFFSSSSDRNRHQQLMTIEKSNRFFE